MKTPIDFGYAIARWSPDSGACLATWRREIHSFCDHHDIFTREEFLDGQVLWVWGCKQKLATFKLLYC